MMKMMQTTAGTDEEFSASWKLSYTVTDYLTYRLNATHDQLQVKQSDQE
jgi:hypothetical protein